MKFGEVFRRKRDGIVVMFIGEAKYSYSTDEMGLNPGSLIGLTLDRGSAGLGYTYWPLHGTANANGLREASETWERIDEGS